MSYVESEEDLNFVVSALAAVLRDRINDLLTANADLERQVARLRYADAARGAAESVETLDKLRRTRDTLNDIVTENDQLKIEVGHGHCHCVTLHTN